MSRKLTPKSSLENLKREAKRWLKALRDNDAAARARLERVLPDADPHPILRDIQHALALEHGASGWSALVAQLDAARASADDEAAVTLLLDAAGEGDAARVAEILDAHPEIVSKRGLRRGHGGLRTALHHAVSGRHADVVRLLLDRRADPNIRDEGDNAMPLHFAAENEQFDIIRMLIEHGADPIGAGDDHELEVIGWATVFGSARRDIVDYLLAHGARHNIHSAVTVGDVAAIRAIAAERKDDIDRPMDRTNHRRRPLHLAVVKKQPASLDALLSLGADTSAIDAARLTPLDQAALNGEADMVRTLRDAGAKITVPAAVVLGRDVERVLAEDPGSLAPGGQWGTLILRAAEQAPGSVIERLIHHGASVDVVDDEATAVDSTSGYTPLHAAAFRGNIHAARALLAHGANVTARDTKYHGTPAGWANYAHHPEIRDLILQGPIDMFDAISFDRLDRLREIFDRDTGALNRRLREYLRAEPGPDEWTKSWWTPLAFAVANNKPAAVRELLMLGAESNVRDPEGRTLLDIACVNDASAIVALLEAYPPEQAMPMEGHDDLVARFLLNACPDHHIRGGWSHIVARATAERLLEQHPELARDSLYTAVVCGDVQYVKQALAERPEAAREKGGPKGSAGGQGEQFVVDPKAAAHPKWEPILYACFARMDHAPTNDNAVEILRLLLDHGADPNAYFMAGDSRYTPLTGVIGEGEEARLPHPHRDAMVGLLLAYGANPYDIQVFYNIHFNGELLWFLRMIHEETVKRGRQADWDDPAWPMLDMGGYGSGARYTLWAAVENNDLELAEWALGHGAGPNNPPARSNHLPAIGLHEAAMQRGFVEMAALLLKHGATPSSATVGVEDEFVAACLRLDRARADTLLSHHPELETSHRAMHAAAKHDRPDVVDLLLSLGVSPDVENPANAERPLHVAAYSDAPNAAARLIAAGAAVDPREKHWSATPFGFALWWQHARMIEVFSRYSGDPWNLVFVGAVDRLREVLAAKPDLAKMWWDEDGTDLLMRLPGDEPRAMEIAKLLIANGADPSRRNKAGETAADLARKRGLADVADHLSS